MNPDRLLAHFDQISDAPDAIPRLRRFILDLAVRGKLVEQDPKDEPASELIKRIRAQRMQSSKEKLKVQPEFYEIDNVEQLFLIPTGWIWLRFGELHALIRGVTYTKADVSETSTPGYLPILRANNIGATLNFEDLVFVRKERVGPEQILRRGDYLIALSSGSKNLVGKAAFVAADYQGGFGGFCGVIRLFTPMVEPFVGLFLSSRLYRDALAQESRGIGINNLKKETITNVLFPLPPLDEQHRIVAKVDELMALCDRLEAAQAERERRRDRLAAASLHRLNNGADADAFREHARFHLRYLPRLTTRLEHIQQLRQTIVHLAFHGRLVPQRQDEGTGVELLKRVQSFHPANRKWGGSRRNGSSLLDPLNCLGVFPIPATWAWTYLDFLCDKIADVDHNMPKAVSDGVPFISAKDLKDDGTIDFSEPKMISEEDYQRLSRKVQIKRDDIVYSRIGARLGKARLVSVDMRFLISYSCCLVRPRHEFIDKHYLQVFLDSTMALNQAHKGTQSIGVPDLGLGEIKSFQVPIPPLAEQHRIVAKVKELLELCDRLEAQLTTAQTESRRLLEATLWRVLAA